ncbi:MAG: transposase [Sphaerochaetaceae bacterium]|nr:transposase [Sphaerochaetaceae bacterium]
MRYHHYHMHPVRQRGSRHSISTGKLEGFNNRIQAAKRIGYGYRDDDSFFTTIRFIPIPDLGSLSPKKT